MKQIDDFDIKSEIKNRSIFDRKLRFIAEKLNLEYIGSGFDSITVECISRINNDIILSQCVGDLITQDDLLTWDKTCEQTSKKLIIITDNVLSNTSGILADNIAVLSVPELLSMTCNLNKKPFNEKNKCNKLFNCFIHRTSPIRQTFFYNVVQYLNLDDCFISMHCYEPFLNISPKEAFNLAHETGEMYKDDKFEKIFREYKEKVPFKNFQEIDGNLHKLIQRSKYSVILESYGQENNSPFICITEKTTRALTSLPIILLFSQKKTVEILKKLGFSVNEITRENDDFDNHWDRLFEIINILYHDDKSSYDINIQQKNAEKNIKLLQSWYDKIFNTDFLELLIKEELKNTSC